MGVYKMPEILFGSVIICRRIIHIRVFTQNGSHPNVWKFSDRISEESISSVAQEMIESENCIRTDILVEFYSHEMVTLSGFDKD